MAEKRELRLRPFQHLGVWIGALIGAGLVALAVRNFIAGLPLRYTVTGFLGLWAACYFAVRWAWYERPLELARKLPISSKELRRRKKEFFANLPR